MKNLLKTFQLLAKVAPNSLSLNAAKVADTAVEEQIVAAIHENLGKIKDELLTVDVVMTVSQFELATQSTMIMLPLFILPMELLLQYDASLMKLNYITLDGEVPTDEILATEGQKAGVFNFTYGSVADQSIQLNLTFKFN